MSDKAKTPEELRALLDAGHPGPWRQGNVDVDTVFVPGGQYIGGERVLLRTNQNYPGSNDIALIVAAVNSLPGHLDRIASLEADLAAAQSRLTSADMVEAMTTQLDACERERDRLRAERDEAVRLMDEAVQRFIKCKDSEDELEAQNWLDAEFCAFLARIAPAKEPSE